ncbi:MAG: transcription termination factor Rho [Thermodesulfobacteriota bacterium]
MEEETKTQEETRDKARLKAEEIGKPLDKMTAIELREVAVLIEGITGASAMKKDELLKLIKEAWDISEEEAPAEKKAVRSGVTVKELKQKVARFKDEKAAARNAGDRSRVDILRRRINRLKKQSRKAARA